MKYCTYIRFQGVSGWLWGWFLVGVSDEKQTSGYLVDFAKLGIKVMLLEMESPLPQNFYFLPKKAKLAGSGTLAIYKT